MGGSTRRITLVADEMLGYTRTGGIGTATSFLAIALGRMGHDVELLYTGKEPGVAISDEWRSVYDRARVRIRPLPRSEETIEPAYFTTPHDVEVALADRPPDVVIAQDLAAPAYAALRLRQVGLGLAETLFVVYCHGGRRWITDTARKVRVLPGAHAITLLEQAAVELADVVVSPSAYLVDWMRGEGWTLPQQTHVIPYLTRAVATGESAPRAEAGRPLERLAFFGRLEDRKGLRPFAHALNALEPDLLRDVEVEFVGAATPAWPPQKIEGLLTPRTRSAVRALSFHTTLDQPEALARLSRAGTLAVMPSLGETFSNAVYECLERGIPFIASDAGAPRELVADEDRARVLFPPTERGTEAALRDVLMNREALRPARAAFEPSRAYDRWSEVVQMIPPRDVYERRRRPHRESTVVGADADPELQQALERAQVASGADVVTCGVRLPSGAQRLFLGDAGGLGVLENHYGTIALVPQELLDDTDEALWPRLARLAADGRQIVSIPRALAPQDEPPPNVMTAPAEALAVVRAFEQRLPDSLRSLARLAAGLAAQQRASEQRPRRSARRLLRRLATR